MLATTYKLIHGDAVLVAQPLLIQHYGRVGALLIQQIHYWSQKGCGVIHNNQRWIHNTVEQWADQLCVSASTVKRAVQRLLLDGAINVKKMAKHKSNQTNSYTINHERLKELIGHEDREKIGNYADDSSYLENQSEKLQNHDSLYIKDSSSFKNNRKPQQVILTQSSDQSEPLVIQKITYKDNNKSESFAHPNSNKMERNEVAEAQSCMTSPRVASSRVISSENMIPHVAEEVKENRHSLPPLLAQNMMDVWNNEVSTKKNINKTKLTREISKYLVASCKYRFNEDLDAWKHYCSLIASSSYLMNKDFVLSLSWALKFSTIDRILAGELGVKKIERVRTEEELRTEALRHIDGVGEGEGCKATRRMILSALGSAIYVSWFKQVDITDDGLTLKAHSRFVEDYIKANFGHVLERVGG